METKDRRDKVFQCSIALGFDGMDIVEPRGLAGGLVLMWKDELDLSMAYLSSVFVVVIYIYITQQIWEQNYLMAILNFYLKLIFF